MVFADEVLAYDPYKSAMHIKSQWSEKSGTGSTTRSRSDIICLVANLTDENYHMISTKEIEMMER